MPYLKRPVTRANSIDEMDVTFLHCRDTGHWWDWKREHHDVLRRSRSGEPLVIDRHLKCLNCRLWIIDEIDVRTGKSSRRRKRYPAGYLAAPGRLYSTDARRELAQRTKATGRASA